MATRDDAMLVIEFSRWATDWGFYEANTWVREHREAVEDYQTFIASCPPTSDGYRYVHTVLGYYENLGLFYKHGVIDVALLFDWLDFISPWDRLGAVAVGLREDARHPDLWANFERLATDQRSWVAQAV